MPDDLDRAAGAMPTGAPNAARGPAAPSGAPAGVVRVLVEVTATHEPIEGRLWRLPAATAERADRSDVPFAGWMGLFAAFERILGLDGPPLGSAAGRPAGGVR